MWCSSQSIDRREPQGATGVLAAEAAEIGRVEATSALNQTRHDRVGGLGFQSRL